MGIQYFRVNTVKHIMSLLKHRKCTIKQAATVSRHPVSIDFEEIL